MSGSNSKVPSVELATLLSRRYVNFEVLPFGFVEFASVKNKDLSKLSCLEYMESGALPELFNLANQETRRNYVSTIKDTVLQKDIIERRNIKDPKLLDDIFIYLVNNALEAITDNHEKLIVALDDTQFPSNRGIKHILAWKLAEII